MACEKGVAANEQRTGPLARERGESVYDLMLSARLQNKNLPADDACRLLRFSFLRLRLSIGGIQQNGNRVRTGREFVQQLQSFGFDLECHHGYAGDVPTGPIEI